MNSLFSQKNQNLNKNPTNYINGNLKILKIQPLPQAHQLHNFQKKIYIPLSIQQEKDIIIIHYKVSIKQILYSNVGYVMHRNSQTLYKMNGEAVNMSELPKVFKYVI